MFFEILIKKPCIERRTIVLSEKKDCSVILTPFCADSVLLYHQMCIGGDSPIVFFDRNPLLEGKEYSDVFIQRMCYLPDSIVIICSEVYGEQIRKELLEIGYLDSQIRFKKDIKTDIDVYSVAELVDVSLFKEYMPGQMTLYNDDSDVLKLRKLKRMKELGAPGNGLIYEDYDGLMRKDNYIDECGNPRIFIKRIELDVTTRCSLRCKKCGNLMQYFNHPEDTPTESVIRDYNRMMELIDWTDDVLIMGGETFLNRELSLVINAVKNHPETEKKVGMVNIVTNGTIIPDNDTIAALAGSDIVVWISNYKNYSSKIQDLCKIFHKNSIRFCVMPLSKWANVQQLITREDALGEDELLLKRKKCWKRHHAVCEGKFFLCAFTNSSYKLGAVPDDEGNYVDIYDENAISRIAEYLSVDNPLPKACSWCNGNFPESWEEKNLIPVAEQVDKPLPYKCYYED